MGPRPAKRRRPAGAHPSASLLPRVSIPPSAQRRLPGGMQEAALALVETPAGGGGWARSALKERRPGPLAGPPLFRLAGRGPGGPPAAKRRRRSVRRSVRRGRRRFGAGAIGPGPGTCPLPGLPGSGRVGFAHPPPPPLRYVFHQRQKGNAKARPFDQPSHAPSTARKKAVATASRAVRNGACASCAGGRCPRFYGSSPGDRRSADRTYRKGTGGLPAFQRGKGRY